MERKLVSPDAGTDLRDRLGITKFEPVLPDTRELAGPFPGQVPKTDEIRLQSALTVLDEIRGHDFYVTTKLDGTSATFFRREDGEFVACSRNWALARGPNPVWRLAERHNLMHRVPIGLAIQGELCGPGIQKNRLDLAHIELYVFSVFDTRRAAYLDFGAARALCADLGLKVVPLEALVTGLEAQRFDHTLEHYLRLAQGHYEGTKNRKEGIVVRPLVDRPSATLGGRLSFKVINNDFLLRDED